MKKHDIYSALSTEIEALAEKSGRTITNTTNALLRYALDQEKAGKISATIETTPEVGERLKKQADKRRLSTRLMVTTILERALDDIESGAWDVKVAVNEKGGATVEFSGELATALLNKGFTPESLKEKSSKPRKYAAREPGSKVP